MVRLSYLKLSLLLRFLTSESFSLLSLYKLTNFLGSRISSGKTLFLYKPLNRTNGIFERKCDPETIFKWISQNIVHKLGTIMVNTIHIYYRRVVWQIIIYSVVIYVTNYSPFIAGDVVLVYCFILHQISQFYCSGILSNKNIKNKQ